MLYCIIILLIHVLKPHNKGKIAYCRACEGVQYQARTHTVTYRCGGWWRRRRCVLVCILKISFLLYMCEQFGFIIRLFFYL